MATSNTLSLEYLGTAVILLDSESCAIYMNPAAESLFGISSKHLLGQPLQQVFADAEPLLYAIKQALQNQAAYVEHDLRLAVLHGKRLQLHCMVTPLHGGKELQLEFHAIDRPLKLAREEQMLDQTQASRLLLRNLAHEIKNPLGGIRGAAQLLEQELEKPALREYTQVVIKEADRLRALTEKLLTPKHLVHALGEVNIHEVLERVRSVVLAEMTAGLVVKRDYDLSLPELHGDKEQLIQAMLNVVRNAAQAMQGKGEITLRTRVARQATLMKRRHRLAIMVQIIDNGPGIPEELRDKIFYPLVSGRADGHGLGLTLAQDFISQHQGSIECESEPGRTCFTILLPIQEKP